MCVVCVRGSVVLRALLSRIPENGADHYRCGREVRATVQKQKFFAATVELHFVQICIVALYFERRIFWRCLQRLGLVLGFVLVSSGARLMIFVEPM